MALTTVFIDIRKRVYEFPKMDIRAKLVCIPTTAGTGSVVMLLTIISAANTSTKRPLADYELLPTMSIVDSDSMLNMPKGVTPASVYDVLTHAVEAYVSVMDSDYTDGFALTAFKSVFKYLTRAYKNGAKDPEARIKMTVASCMAGIAFATAFLGENHSLAHKLSGWHHIPTAQLMRCFSRRYVSTTSSELLPRWALSPSISIHNTASTRRLSFTAWTR